MLSTIQRINTVRVLALRWPVSFLCFPPKRARPVCLCAPRPRTIHFISSPSSPKRILCYSTHAQLRSMTYVFAIVLPPRTSTDFWVRTLIRNRINETFCVRTTVSFSGGRGSFRSTHTFLLGRTVFNRQHNTMKLSIVAFVATVGSAAAFSS